MPRVVVMHSHKGGSGRSTATVNVAYQLACEGKRVCMVDLDLKAASLDFLLGVDIRGHLCVHDFLPQRKPDDTIWVPYDASAIHRAVKACGDGLHNPELSLFLVPGALDVMLHVDDEDAFSNQLHSVIDNLWENYDFLLLDIESGENLVFNSLISMKFNKLWLEFFRWTPQHVRGVKRIDDRLSVNGDYNPRRLVRTAQIEVESYGEDVRDFYAALDGELRLKTRSGGLMIPGPDVPRDDVLLWREGIIDRDLDPSLPETSATTTAAYRQLAEIIDQHQW